MSHYQDPSYVLAVAIVFLVLGPMFLGLRFYSKSLQKSGLGIDDWLLIPALVLVIGCAVVLIIGVGLKYLAYPTPKPPDGEDFFSTPNRSFTVVQQLQWAFFLMQIVSTGLIKLSFIFFFRGIFKTGQNPTFDRITKIAGVIMVVWTLTFVFWEMFACGANPTHRWTMPADYVEYCTTDIMSNFALGISDFVTDLIVLAIPFPMVLRLNVNRREKLLVSAAFGFGIVGLHIYRAIGASAIRMGFVIYLDFAPSGPQSDPNLIVTEALYWSMLESGLGILACCVSAMGRLFHLSSMNTRAHGPAWPGTQRRRSSSSGSRAHKGGQTWDLERFRSGGQSSGNTTTNSSTGSTAYLFPYDGTTVTYPAKGAKGPIPKGPIPKGSIPAVGIPTVRITPVPNNSMMTSTGTGTGSGGRAGSGSRAGSRAGGGSRAGSRTNGWTHGRNGNGNGNTSPSPPARGIAVAQTIEMTSSVGRM